MLTQTPPQTSSWRSVQSPVVPVSLFSVVLEVSLVEDVSLVDEVDVSEVVEVSDEVEVSDDDVSEVVVVEVDVVEVEVSEDDVSEVVGETVVAVVSGFDVFDTPSVSGTESVPGDVLVDADVSSPAPSPLQAIRVRPRIVDNTTDAVACAMPRGVAQNGQRVSVSQTCREQWGQCCTGARYHECGPGAAPGCVGAIRRYAGKRGSCGTNRNG